MVTELRIRENLEDAGCSRSEIEEIMSCYQKGDMRKTRKLIESCRKHQVDRLHESQQCIDRLNFLNYQLERQV